MLIIVLTIHGLVGVQKCKSHGTLLDVLRMLTAAGSPLPLTSSFGKFGFDADDLAAISRRNDPGPGSKKCGAELDHSLGARVSSTESDS